MKDKPSTVDLGFSETHLPPGTHVCQIYTDSEERDESLLRFLLAGVEAGERVACFSEDVHEPAIDTFFREHGVSFADAMATQALSVSKASDVYFQGGRFEPNVMLGLLAQFHRDAITAGCPGARVIGEMSAQITQVAGGDRLLEYESRVSMLLREHPVTAVCQYSAHAFDGAMIMDVLKVHPMMVVRGTVVHNPFYVSPEEYLS